jgi:hypothetical protein
LTVASIVSEPFRVLLAHDSHDWQRGIDLGNVLELVAQAQKTVEANRSLQRNLESDITAAQSAKACHDQNPDSQRRRTRCANCCEPKCYQQTSLSQIQCDMFATKESLPGLLE